MLANLNLTLEQASEILELSIGDYVNVRTRYWTDVDVAVHSYLLGNQTTAEFKNFMNSAIRRAFQDAADIAWMDGKALLPLETETQNYLLARMQEDYSFTVSLGQRLRMIRQEGMVDYWGEARARADGYTRTLDNIYSSIKLLALPNVMLTFAGMSGKPPEFPCKDCKRLIGKRHRAKWWVAHDKIPGSHTGFECGGWKCRHVLIDDGGQLYAL